MVIHDYPYVSPWHPIISPLYNHFCLRSNSSWRNRYIRSRYHRSDAHTRCRSAAEPKVRAPLVLEVCGPQKGTCCECAHHLMSSSVCPSLRFGQRKMLAMLLHMYMYRYHQSIQGILLISLWMIYFTHCIPVNFGHVPATILARIMNVPHCWRQEIPL